MLLQLTEPWSPDRRQLQADLILGRLDDIERAHPGEIVLFLHLPGGVVTLESAEAFAQAMLRQVALGRVR